jgi:hypothetical protein
MKTFLLALLFSPLLGFGQTTEAAEFGTFALATTNKDTLYLVANDPLSKITFSVWKNDPTWDGTCPTILWVSSSEMAEFKNKSIASVRTNKTATASTN